MKAPWSKLQRAIYELLDDNINIQIQCRKYRMPNSMSSHPYIPRYWITLGKEIIFDVPKDATLKQKYTMYDHIPEISDTIREYIDSPLEGLVEKIFSKDTFGITDILKAADRRIGKRQWNKLPDTEPVRKILQARKGA